MYRRLLTCIIFTGMSLCVANALWAQSPPLELGSNPPVFQTLGMLDTELTFLSEAECRVCHSSGVPNRHHNLYGPEHTCISCHGDEMPFRVQRDCLECHTSSPHHEGDNAFERHCVACHGDYVDDYDDGHYIPSYDPSLVTPKRSLTGEGFFEDGTPHTISTGEGLVAIGDVPAGPQTRKFPNTLTYTPPGLNNDFIIAAPRGSTYNLTVEFHEGPFAVIWDGSDADNKFLDVYIPDGAPVKAGDPEADPLEDGTLLVEINKAIGSDRASLGYDGPADALYPYYNYAPEGGQPPNNRGFDAGACSYCHWDDGATDINGDPAPVLIVNNHDTHHHIDLVDPISDGAGGTWRRCNVCHDYTDRTPHLDPADPTRRTYSDVGGAGFDLAIRICEECHGPDSLHSIQADSPAAGNIGTIVVGGEDAGYGHVGRDGAPGDSDCWGCHGFAGPEMPMSAAELITGPLTPTLYNIDPATISAGKSATVVLSGVAFANTADGTLYESKVRLTAADGSSVILEPDVILDQGNLVVTIPAATAPGNYKLQATKDDVASNPAVLSVVPAVTITRAIADRMVTITGSGFGGYAEGSGTTVTGTVIATVGRRTRERNLEATIISWSDTKIVARFFAIPNKVTVRSVFGSATATTTTTRLSR